MSGVLRSFDRWWLCPAPALRPAIVRILVGAYCLVLLLVRGSHYAAVASLPPARFSPLGVVRLLDTPLAPSVATVLVGVTALLGIAFTVGYRYRITAPAFAIALLWITTYRNSWGHVSHGDNLVVLHVLVVSLAPAADALSLDARGAPPRDWSSSYGWPLRLMAMTTAATYVLAGWAKLRFGGTAWLGGEAVQLQVAFDALRKSRFGLDPSPLAATLVPHAWAFAPAAIATLCLELGAPVALMGRRLAATWAVGMWLVHVGIAVVMTLAFAYPLSLIAFAPLFRLERGAAWLRRRRSRRKKL